MTRTAATWLFEVWPDVDAVNPWICEDSFDQMEDLLRSLLDPEGTVSG